MSTFYIKEGDTAPAITATLKDADGNPVSLTSVDSVNIRVAGARGGDNIVDERAQIVDASEGVVRYRFDESETADDGRYRVEFAVNYDAGYTETFPNDDYHTILMSRNLEK